VLDAFGLPDSINRGQGVEWSYEQPDGSSFDLEFDDGLVMDADWSKPPKAKGQ